MSLSAKRIVVCDDGLIYVRNPQDRWCDLGEDGEFEVYTIEFDPEEDPYHFTARGRWFRPCGEVTEGELIVTLDAPLEPNKEYTAEDLLFARWECWQVE